MRRICYARYADDLLLGIMGAVELLIEIPKRIAHFLRVQSFFANVHFVLSAGEGLATVEFLGTVILRLVHPNYHDPKTTLNILRVKHLSRLNHRIPGSHTYRFMVRVIRRASQPRSTWIRTLYSIPDG